MSIVDFDIKVKKAPYQLSSENLTLADLTLEKANRYRQEWLMTGAPQAWRLWQVCLHDRAALLGEVGDG